MFKFNNSIVPNKLRIGWHFSSNKYVYRDAYSALKSGGRYPRASSPWGEAIQWGRYILLHRNAQNQRSRKQTCYFARKRTSFVKKSQICYIS